MVGSIQEGIPKACFPEHDLTWDSTSSLSHRERGSSQLLLHRISMGRGLLPSLHRSLFLHGPPWTTQRSGGGRKTSRDKGGDTAMAERAEGERWALEVKRDDCGRGQLKMRKTKNPQQGRNGGKGQGVRRALQDNRFIQHRRTPGGQPRRQGSSPRRRINLKSVQVKNCPPPSG